jgi:ABC-2 type transport system ATP-binding protein
MGVIPGRSRRRSGANLLLFAELFNVPRARVNEVLHLTGLTELAKRPVRRLSKGERQRTALARAFLHRPTCLFLDEPTSGLDPGAREEFHQVLRALQAEGVTILLASHDLAEVEALCQRAAILEKGRMLAVGALAELKVLYGRPGTVTTLQDVYLRATGRVS